ncbi:aquaporin AQPAe.a-like [Leptopilina heterotoma]|uniref:aquaporin AQPAe.a-like n=1 Tax=Leptopilina heterotoma TaxID=63436 RepID=UPI001CA9DC4E|nr:aquaporin AQPAe.a-like [Leptopilina heterotoma]
MSSSNIRSRVREITHHEEATLKQTVVLGLSEFLGTSILVFLGCMGCVGTPSHLQITLNFGLSVMIVIQIFGHISHAHVNPSITVGAMVLGKKSLTEGLIYILCQTGGSILGYGMLKIVIPYSRLGDPKGDFCVTSLSEDVGTFQGLIVELISTAVLMMIACAVWDKRNERNTDSVAIKFGLAVTALATAAGPFTGCSMNPARSFGPAIWNNSWSQQWIYWIGPISGSIVAAFIYKTIFETKDIKTLKEPEESITLNSIETDKN